VWQSVCNRLGDVSSEITTVTDGVEARIDQKAEE